MISKLYHTCIFFLKIMLVSRRVMKKGSTIKMALWYSYRVAFYPHCFKFLNYFDEIKADHLINFNIKLIRV